MASIGEGSETGNIRNVIRIDEGEIRNHLDGLVKTSVEDVLNQHLDQAADQLCGAKRYERNPGRVDTRSGSYSRKLQTKAGEVTLQVPHLRTLPFETQIIERYKRRESSVEEALVEMYLAGVSVRRVEDITEALWGSRVSASTVSELNQKVYGQIEAWRNKPIEGEHPYLYLDGIWLKRTWGGEVPKVALLVAISVNADGYREILGVCEGMQEDKESWPPGAFRVSGWWSATSAWDLWRRCINACLEPTGSAASSTSIGTSWPRCPVRGSVKLPRCSRPSRLMRARKPPRKRPRR